MIAPIQHFPRADVSHFVKECTASYPLFDISFWYGYLHVFSYILFAAILRDFHVMSPWTIVAIALEFTHFFETRSITKKYRQLSRSTGIGEIGSVPVTA